MTFSVNIGPQILLNSDVNRAGVLHFTIQSRQNDGTLFAEEFSAKEAFGAMLEFYGSRVRVIQGEWSNKRSYLQHNLTQLNRSVANGVPLKEAVLETWTGKRAMEFGFTNADVISETRNPENPSESINLVVQFSKP